MPVPVASEPVVETYREGEAEEAEEAEPVADDAGAEGGRVRGRDGGGLSPHSWRRRAS